MRFPGFARLTMLALGLAALPVATGCGGNPFNPPEIIDGGGLPPETPLNDTPANTMTRFEGTYEHQVLDQYELLFASNFRFTFSNQSDPELVTIYGNNWGKDDETSSTSHLFDGFTNDQGEFVPGAVGIMLGLPGQQFIDDPTANPDSGAYYKLVIVPTVSLQLAGPGTDGLEVASTHYFYLVRGDAAVLDAGQPATPARWYLRRQEDRSLAVGLRVPAEFAPSRVLPSRVTTWGAVKAFYR